MRPATYRPRPFLVLTTIIALLATSFATLTMVRPALAATATIYVDAARPDDDGDGTSWASAKKYLPSALALANPTAPATVEIWVADGTYYPDEGSGQTDNARTSTFALKDGVAIYGGFAGDEVLRSARNPVANRTILSGDLDGTPADAAGNAYHVVSSTANTTTAVLDGFTISGGNADGSDPANNRGGGLSTVSGSQAHFANLTISGNTAVGGGGVVNEGSSPSFSNVTLSGNTASLGGGVYNEGGSPSFTNVTIRNNTARTSGGGMYNEGGNPSFSNVTISDNTASLGGGGFNDTSSPSFSNVTISGNTAFSGGGMYNEGGKPSFSNVIIRNNTASNGGGGGGVYNDTSSPSFSNITLSGNTASLGGGVYNEGGSPNFTNVTINGNTASNGGGVLNDEGSPSFSTVTISGNTASDGGGGVFNDGGSPSFSNVTISGNTASTSGGGGGVSNEANSSPNFSNSIIWGNSSQVVGATATPSYAYSLVQGETLTGTGNLAGTTDPLFIAPEPAASAPTTAGNYRLQATSPLIDQGSNALLPAGVTTDRDGKARIVNDIVDLGAYEFRVTYMIFLPFM